MQMVVTFSLCDKTELSSFISESVSSALSKEDKTYFMQLKQEFNKIVCWDVLDKY